MPPQQKEVLSIPWVQVLQAFTYPIKPVPMEVAVQTVSLALIEDNPLDAAIVRKVVEQVPGFLLAIVEKHGAVGLESSLLPKSSAVLWSLPPANDWDLGRFKDFRKSFPEVPVLFLADPAQRPMAAMLLKEGGQDYLEKGSFTAAQLEKAVVSAMQRQVWMNAYITEKHMLCCPIKPEMLAAAFLAYSQDAQGILWSQAQAALKESNRKFSTLIQNLPGIVYRSTKNGCWHLEFISEGTTELTGFPPDTFLGKEAIGKVKWLSIVHPDDKHKVLAAVDNAIATHSSYQVAYRIMTRGKAMKWLWEQGSVIYGAQGEPVAMEGFVQDMTDRVEAEEKMNQTHRQFATLISNLPGIVFRSIKDPASPNGWKLDFISEGAKGLTGYQASDFLGSSGTKVAWLALVNPADASLVASQVMRAVEKRKPYQVTYRIRTKHGQERWLWEQGRALYDNSGHPTSLEGFIHDITDRKRAEQQLIASFKERQRLIGEQNTKLEERVAKRTAELTANQQQLNTQNHALQQTLERLKAAQSQLVQSEKMASLGQLTAGIAHEINNPVNYIHSSMLGLQEVVDDLKAIMGAYQQVNAENSVEKLKEIQELKNQMAFGELMEGLDVLIGNIKKGTGRTAEIVKGLRTFSRMDDQQWHPCNLHEIIDTTLLLLHNQYKDHVQVCKNYAELPLVKGHPGKLGQVFMNLLSNAVQSIQGKGAIAISTGTTGRDTVEIKVQDTGEGISQENLPRIFDPFFTTKDVGEGLGLGLSVTYQIIEAHHGRIHAESKLGQGTTFTVELPVELPGMWANTNHHYH
jgi:PAS domain S-box-containing protein